jgi:hypothetical protein
VFMVQRSEFGGESHVSSPLNRKQQAHSPAACCSEVEIRFAGLQGASIPLAVQ